MPTDTAPYNNAMPTMASLVPMVVDKVEYPYSIEGIRGTMVGRGLRIAEQLRVVMQLLDECVDHEFYMQLLEFCNCLLEAHRQGQEIKMRITEELEKITPNSQKGKKRGGGDSEERKFEPERVRLDHIPDDADRKRIERVATWLIEAGVIEGCSVRQLSALFGAYPTEPIVAPIRCAKPANVVSYLLQQLQGLLWNRSEEMNTVATDVCHAICTTLVRLNGLPYNEDSVRTSGRQVNSDVEAFFSPLLRELRK